MFRLKFPSGATLEFKGGYSEVGTDTYQGTLYIWPEDLDELLEIVQKEKENDSSVSQSGKDRDKSSGL